MIYRLLLILVLIFGLGVSSYATSLPEQTTTAIDGDETFTSGTYAIGSATAVVVIMEASHDSAAAGVKIDQSFDTDCVTAASPTFQYTSTFSYTATNGAAYIAQAIGKCFRVRYVNGSTNQTSFDLTTNLWGIR